MRGVVEHRDRSLFELDWSDPTLQAQLGTVVNAGRFIGFADALARVGNCAHPIRLRGSSERIDPATGEVLGSYSSAAEPLGVTYVRCGNRRAERCLACSRLYARDLFQLIRSGVCGGKTVPATVADNPLVFATLTAPSFGQVHRHTRSGVCRPGPPSWCRHGRPLICRDLHPHTDQLLGQPLCPDCYDHTSQIIWQWWSSELWRRFTINLRRAVARHLGLPETRLARLATVQYAKVAEYQRRGVIHFHALIRLDGPRSPEGFAPAPASIDAAQLARLVRTAVESAWLVAPPVDAADLPRRIVFGAQLDVRPVRLGFRTDEPDQPLRPDQVAGYLAKYATKSATDTGPGPNPHGRRLRATVLDLAARSRDHALLTGVLGPYQQLGRWIGTLGFHGHFSSRSRRYSITLGALRRARRRVSVLLAAQAATDTQPLDLAALEDQLLADDTDTTLIIGHWNYLGAGWDSDAEHALAVASAARAREHDQQRAEHRKAAAQSENQFAGRKE
ncbi:MAG TPA: replication initiator [Microlunatus sp.]|nr:replication initiator [Microlunatus sp.]